jgi:hypothetical protein
MLLNLGSSQGNWEWTFFSFERGQAVDPKGITKVSGLDLAALFLVLDSNCRPNRTRLSWSSES